MSNILHGGSMRYTFGRPSILPVLSADRLPLRELSRSSAHVPGMLQTLAGHGYPDGRERDEVPLAARIVTVADCFNAMIGRRAYRPAMAPSDALEQLQLHKGSQFDSEVVAAMHEVVLQR